MAGPWGEGAQLGFLVPCHIRAEGVAAFAEALGGSSCGYWSGALAVVPLKQPKIPVAGVLSASKGWGLTGSFSPQCLFKQV